MGSRRRIAALVLAGVLASACGGDDGATVRSLEEGEGGSGTHAGSGTGTGSGMGSGTGSS